MKQTGKFYFVMLNLSISFAIAVITLVILNYFNPMLGILSSIYTKTVIIIYCVVVLVSSIMSLIFRKRKIAAQARRRNSAAAERGRYNEEAQERDVPARRQGSYGGRH